MEGLEAVVRGDGDDEDFAEAYLESNLRRVEALMSKAKPDTRPAAPETEKKVLAANCPISDSLRVLQKRSAKLTEQIELTKMDLKYTQADIDETAKFKVRYIRRLGGVQAVNENDRFVARQTSILESRIVKAKQNIMESKAINTAKRNAVDELRRENLIFSKAVKQGKRQVKELTRRCSNIKENIEKKKRFTAMLKEKTQQLERVAAARCALFTREWEELGEALAILDKESCESNAEQLGTMSKREESRLKQETVHGQWRMVFKRVLAKNAVHRAASYSDAFKAIQKATNVTDLDDFIETFKTIEDQNFALFSDMNACSKEIKRLQEEINALTAEREGLMAQMMEEDTARENILNSLENRIADATRKSQNFKSKADERQKTLTTIDRLVTKLFESLKSARDRQSTSEEPLVDALTPPPVVVDGSVSESVMQTLGQIEQKIFEIAREHRDATSQGVFASGTDTGSSSPRLARRDGFFPLPPRNNGNSLLNPGPPLPMRSRESATLKIRAPSVDAFDDPSDSSSSSEGLAPPAGDAAFSFPAEPPVSSAPKRRRVARPLTMEQIRRAALSDVIDLQSTRPRRRRVQRAKKKKGSAPFPRGMSRRVLARNKAAFSRREPVEPDSSRSEASATLAEVEAEEARAGMGEYPVVEVEEEEEEEKEGGLKVVVEDEEEEEEGVQQ